MKSNLTTIVPVYNGERFIRQTLESVARQTVRPDQLLVIDNCSTDRTEQAVREFQSMPCTFLRNPSNLGLFRNMNRAREYAAQTRYLHILCADDLVHDGFYDRLTRELDSCDGLGLAYSLDERIDENNRRLSVSGRISDSTKVFTADEFIAGKAEIANQALSGSLLKTNHRPSPVQFRLDMPILADVVFWADWGRHCQKIVQINLPLCQYRWHGDNTTNVVMPGIEALILDEWRTMQMNEALRDQKPGWIRQFKLKGLFGVRTGIKAKRILQLGDTEYSREIVKAGKERAGLSAWYLAQVVVEARDLAIYGILRRPRHPKNVYS